MKRMMTLIIGILVLASTSSATLKEYWCMSELLPDEQFTPFCLYIPNNTTVAEVEANIYRYPIVSTDSAGCLNRSLYNLNRSGIYAPVNINDTNLVCNFKLKDELGDIIEYEGEVYLTCNYNQLYKVIFLNQKICQWQIFSNSTLLPIGLKGFQLDDPSSYITLFFYLPPKADIYDFQLSPNPVRFDVSHMMQFSFGFSSSYLLTLQILDLSGRQVANITDISYDKQIRDLYVHGSWDGKDNHGRYVLSGVYYLVIAYYDGLAGKGDTNYIRKFIVVN